MGKSFDIQIVNPIITSFIEDILVAKGSLVASKPCEIAAKPIDEYANRMIIKASDKFDVPVFIAASSLYLSAADMNAHRACGAMAVYVDIEVADKIFKAAGLQVPYDEDDDSMMALCGQFCTKIIDALKTRLAQDDYPKLEASIPVIYRNAISEGVEFSKGQNEKQEMSFYFFKHKALVIDWTLVPLVKK
ncbi:MAG: hypothetical protein HQL13_03880 [Candidatus Omnitrophica bacterium]|nr:hypothetical protein [Candidatus Omnitrophota bacterium]